MAQPRVYSPSTNFTDHSTVAPSNPHSGANLDVEFVELKQNTDDLNTNIALLQRDDGKLLNASVHKDAFDQDALALIGASGSGFTPRGDWVTATAYVSGDLVTNNAATYLTVTASHTSGTTFAGDLASHWQLIANSAIETTSASVDTHNGTGSQTLFTTTYTYSAPKDIQVFVNGALQIPTAYTVTNTGGNNITFTTAPPIGTGNVIIWGATVVAEAAKAGALIYRDEAGASATSSATSATTATTQAGVATTQANSATTNGATATAQAGIATTQAGTATTQAGIATTQAGTATTQAGTSTTQAATSTTQAGIATTQAGIATTQVGLATTQATNAATSATNAATSATSTAADLVLTNADVVLTNADVVSTAGSASAAATSAANAAASYDQFDDRYLGTFTTAAEPTVDNDGAALVTGALYFNSTSNSMMVYDGGNWIAATSAGTASLLEYKFVTTSAQVTSKTYSGTADVGGSFSYTQSNTLVFLNGVLLKYTTDYTATNGTSIVLVAAPVLSDELTVVAFKSFTVADTVSAASGGTFSGAVTASAGVIGDLTGNADTVTTNANLTGDVTSSGNATTIAGLAMSKTALVGGTGLTLSTNTLSVDAAQPAITSVGTLTGFTSTGIDDNATSTAITIDASENVGIGTATPTAAKLVISADGSTKGASFTGNGIEIKHPTTTSDLFIGTQTGSDVKIASAGTNPLLFYVNSGERMRIDSTGRVTMPSQPIISGQVGSYAAMTGPVLITFNDFWINQGGIVYNTTTKRFTVPVAGKYRITFNPFFANATCRVFIGVNTDSPAATTHKGHAYWTSGSTAALYSTGCINSVVSLAASDYIVYKLNSGVLYNTSADRFNQFSIQLIG